MIRALRFLTRGLLEVRMTEKEIGRLAIAMARADSDVRRWRRASGSAGMIEAAPAWGAYLNARHAFFAALGDFIVAEEGQADSEPTLGRATSAR